ncbi:hypothetical protein [Alteromonas lipolytica]|uniref:Uncharacterized protein n=1 Tax=Alteromonas lipolytica TaxID=1856405 RepID=A0A1E8FC56_9ALTE|nr:hypothetical protein [Alteromonas lipolytica]OFI33376.1 hypothetical protein BFC17_03695 [Alteromonas lipolytica]GGF60281.1 hypothetical protein GCM10011338_10630 [Alteromonas lipolytica]
MSVSLNHNAKGKRPKFYEDAGTDQLMSMVMVLASELNVMRDRMDAQERVAKQHGIDLAAGIDALELDDAALEEREAWRQGFMARLFYLARKEAEEAQIGETKESFNSTIDEIAKG